MGFRQLLVSATESETLEEQAEQYGLTGCFEAVLGAENFLGEERQAWHGAIWRKGTWLPIRRFCRGHGT